MPEGYDADTGVAIATEVDNFLLRFVDCDVRPGRTYEYRIRLRMWNPNFGQEKLVANPEFAKDNCRLLYSRWVQLVTPITVPDESYIYAYDVSNYGELINETYPTEGKKANSESKALNKMFQIRDDQAVIQIARWMERVTAGDATKSEPVGSWVVAEIPVGRGEFLGRKQYIRLPLWSSEAQEYILRQVPDKIARKYQPKGWLVDFSTRSVLVDFEGGKVRTKANVRFDIGGNPSTYHTTIEEEAATEMLIVDPNGKVTLHKSEVDGSDLVRKAIAEKWDQWVKEVESHKELKTDKNQPNEFDPKKN